MSITVRVRKNVELGTWQGIGGAITEATAYNFFKLKPDRQKAFLDVYYGKDGLDYRWGRVSVGSNDFCLKSYEYTSAPDLADFSIEHDMRYVIPLLKKITSRKELRLMASSWSPPSCMKTSKILQHGGRLKLWQYKNYAKYLRKWLESYEKQGITIDFLSPQNEPFARQEWESCVYPLWAQRRLAYKYLSHELEGLNTQLLLWDHNKGKLPKIAQKLLKSDEYGADKRVAGLCYHWYDGTFADEMWRVRQMHPEAVLISSEMCCGFSQFDAKEWQKDAKMYLFELFSNINCGASAWIDWNILLDYDGGPSYCSNNVKSPVILNEQGNDFILTPIYAALKQFAALFPAGSEVLRCEINSDKIAAIARQTKMDYEVILANVSNKEHLVSVELDGQDKGIILKPLEMKKIVFRR